MLMFSIFDKVNAIIHFLRLNLSYAADAMIMIILFNCLAGHLRYRADCVLGRNAPIGELKWYIL